MQNYLYVCYLISDFYKTKQNMFSELQVDSKKSARRSKNGKKSNTNTFY
jgi:hypothetical protein